MYNPKENYGLQHILQKVINYINTNNTDNIIDDYLRFIINYYLFNLHKDINTYSLN